MNRIYIKELPELLADGGVEVAVVDEAGIVLAHGRGWLARNGVAVFDPCWRPTLVGNAVDWDEKLAWWEITEKGLRELRFWIPYEVK